ncbi:MAG TPA: hypothetical protein VM346_09415 [Sphingomicrobium sp.]|nr:hypothetical protein [Sphingomicrobium sp.]
MRHRRPTPQRSHAMLRILIWIVVVIFLIGLLVVSGILSAIF